MGPPATYGKHRSLSISYRLITYIAVILGAFLVVRVVFAAVTFQDVNPDSSTVTQDDNATSGGRVNGIAVDPTNNQVAYAASEWGGIYKTTNGGNNWAHLDNHLPQATWDVEVDRSNVSRVYATSFYDGRSINQALGIQPLSGIEVSNDGGATWTHPATATPAATYNCSAVRRSEPSAFGIAIRSDASNNVFIGTNCGVAISTDSGATWTFVDPTPGTTASDVWDIVVQAGGTNNQGIIDICGDDGHLRSIDGGATWNAGAGLPAGAGSVCSIAASPLESGVLFAIVRTSSALWEGDIDTNQVIQWTQLCGPGSPSSPCNQGLRTRHNFVETNQTDTNAFDLYIGASTTLFRITGCNNTNTPTRCPTNTRGTDVGSANGAHADPAALEFDSTQSTPSCPLFYSNDGGIYSNNNTTAPGCLDPGWQRSMVGLHATWLWDMAGTPLAGNTGVYFGLQDDGFWGSADAAATWANPECCDVFDVVADGNQVVYSVCCVTGQSPATRLFSRPANNPGGGRTTIFDNNTLPPSGWLMEFQQLPSIDTFGTNNYIFVTQATGNFDAANGNGAGGIFVTQDNFGTFTQLDPATTTPRPAGACGVQASVSAGTPTFYVITNNCNGFGGQLWSYTGTASNGTWRRADTGLTSVGIYAVDPNNPNRLYASDLTPGGPRMVSSTNAGATWNADPELDSMMTQNGVFKYQTGRGPTNFTFFSAYTQPSLLAYDPLNGNFVVAGGRDSGVFYSPNGGQDWGLLTDPINPGGSGIPDLTRPWSAFFDLQTAGTVNLYIGTQGRGVWRLVLRQPTANVDPVITNEGTDVQLIGTGNDPDGASPSCSWEFDNDGQLNDAIGNCSPTYDQVGQDGIFPVRLKVTAGRAFTVNSTTVTVNNVPPLVALATNGPKDENSAIMVSGTVTDPGWLEHLTATVDWGDGTPVQSITGILENVRPDATLTFSTSHVYGDNGTFTAKVCGSDDDSTTCNTIALQIDNVKPTAEIDKTNTIPINGIPTFLAHAGEPLQFNGHSTDPGSDDLTLSWDWDDGPPSPDVTRTDLVNPPNLDPLPSPSIQPRDVFDMETHAFEQACLYEIGFSSIDDDGGSSSDSAFVLITANEDRARSTGDWQHQLGRQGHTDFDDATLECYLKIIDYASTVFGEARDASNIPAAHDVLFLKQNGGSEIEQLDRELMTAWLNFADGAFEHDQLFDPDHDGAYSAFADIIAIAEAVRLSPTSTASEIRDQKNILQQLR